MYSTYNWIIQSCQIINFDGIWRQRWFAEFEFKQIKNMITQNQYSPIFTLQNYITIIHFFAFYCSKLHTILWNMAWEREWNLVPEESTGNSVIIHIFISHSLSIRTLLVPISYRMFNWSFWEFIILLCFEGICLSVKEFVKYVWKSA